MFTPIEGLGGGAIGFEALGRVTRDDLRRVLEPEIDAVLDAGDKVRLLYVTGPGFAGYEDGAPLDDTVFGSRHFRDFERIAFVADDGPYDRAVHAIEGLMPAEVRVFPTRRIDAAKAWLSR